MSDESILALGIDIGGTGTKLGVVDAEGGVEGFRTFPTDAKGSDPAPFLSNLQSAVTRLLDEVQRPVRGIGVSAHGFIDDERRGPIACESTPALRGVDLKAWLGTHYDLPVIVNNDLTAHVLAEHYFGSGRGMRRFLTLAVGTGLGAGVIINGQPLRFLGGNAGDTGRVILQPGGPKCVYGVGGSAEALCGVAAIERLAAERYGRQMTAREIITAARIGDDEIAIGIIQEIGANLGLLLASLSAIYFPHRIALTGGTTAAGPVLLDACRLRFEEIMGEYHRIESRLQGDLYNGVEIVLGEKGAEAGVLGAVVEIFQSINQTNTEVDTF